MKKSSFFERIFGVLFGIVFIVPVLIFVVVHMIMERIYLSRQLKRLKKAGYKIMSVPDARVIHLEGKSCETNNKREQMKSASKKIYYTKTSRITSYYISNFLVFLNANLRYLFAILSRNKDSQEYWSIIRKNI